MALQLHKNSSSRVCYIGFATYYNTSYNNALSKQLERACCFIDT